MWASRQWTHYSTLGWRATPDLRREGPRWTCGWGLMRRRRQGPLIAGILFRIPPEFSLVESLRSGRYQTSPAIAAELLRESNDYAELTAHEQVAALRDVVRRYGPGRSG